MDLSKNYRLDNVWATKTPEIEAEIIDFWLDSGALPNREESQKRVGQVTVLGRTAAEGQIVSVSSVYPQFNQQLGYSFYYFRCFVAEEHRRAYLARHMLLATQEEFNARFVAGENLQILGMIIETQSTPLRQHRTRAVWSETGFTYIGRNERSEPVRVFYFDDARIA